MRRTQNETISASKWDQVGSERDSGHATGVRRVSGVTSTTQKCARATRRYNDNGEKCNWRATIVKLAKWRR